LECPEGARARRLGSHLVEVTAQSGSLWKSGTLVFDEGAFAFSGH
jgi:hypothetical protein